MAHTFHQMPSELQEIRDWWTAREFNVAAADYVRRELMKREFEREERDRNFWISMFGGSNNGSNGEPEIVIEEGKGEVAFGTR